MRDPAGSPSVRLVGHPCGSPRTRGKPGAVYVITRLLPDSNISTLTDRVIDLGILTVALAIGASTLSGHYANRGDEATSQWIDRLSFVILAVAYILINTLIPIVAKT